MKEERYRRRDMERVFFLFQLCITKILLIIYQTFLLYYLTLIISSYFNLTTHVNIRYKQIGRLKKELKWKMLSNAQNHISKIIRTCIEVRQTWKKSLL